MARDRKVRQANSLAAPSLAGALWIQLGGLGRALRRDEVAGACVDAVEQAFCVFAPCSRPGAELPRSLPRFGEPERIAERVNEARRIYLFGPIPARRERVHDVQQPASFEQIDRRIGSGGPQDNPRLLTRKISSIAFDAAPGSSSQRPVSITASKAPSANGKRDNVEFSSSCDGAEAAPEVSRLATSKPRLSSPSIRRSERRPK